MQTISLTCKTRKPSDASLHPSLPQPKSKPCGHDSPQKAGVSLQLICLTAVLIWTVSLPNRAHHFWRILKNFIYYFSLYSRICPLLNHKNLKIIDWHSETYFMSCFQILIYNFILFICLLICMCVDAMTSTHV